MAENSYRICNRCIMDTTDPGITFDSDGNCSNCNSALSLAVRIWKPNNEGEKELDEIINRIKKDGSKKEYDCVIGLSGGVDSSYLAYLSVKKGLRPLVVHVDCGWNSGQAVRNVENIVKKLNLELHTFVVNWEDMKDLQRAFFKASVPDLDIPQDHAIFAALYQFAEKNRIKYVLNGYNFATECIMPSVWGHQAMDYKHLKSIHKLFGNHKLVDYPHLNFFSRYIYFTLVRKMKIIYPLNYIEYNKELAIEKMSTELDWHYYGGKHYESRFTKFFQSYYLPVKFNIDKRRGHLSSMIISGQINRAEALKLMNEKTVAEDEIENEIEFVAKKLDWTVKELKDIINLPPRRHEEYPTNDALFRIGVRVKSIFRK